MCEFIVKMSKTMSFYLSCFSLKALFTLNITTMTTTPTTCRQNHFQHFRVVVSSLWFAIHLQHSFYRLNEAKWSNNNNKKTCGIHHLKIIYNACNSMACTHNLARCRKWLIMIELYSKYLAILIAEFSMGTIYISHWNWPKRSDGHTHTRSLSICICSIKKG